MTGRDRVDPYPGDDLPVQDDTTDLPPGDDGTDDTLGSADA